MRCLISLLVMSKRRRLLSRLIQSLHRIIRHNKLQTKIIRLHQIIIKTKVKDLVVLRLGNQHIQILFLQTLVDSNSNSRLLKIKTHKLDQLPLSLIPIKFKKKQSVTNLLSKQLQLLIQDLILLQILNMKVDIIQVQIVTLKTILIAIKR